MYMKIEPKIYFTAWKNDGSKKTWLKPTQRRIGLAVASDKYKKYHLKVEYGKSKCANDCVCTFDNEVISENKEDIRWGLTAFMDKDLYLEN